MAVKCPKRIIPRLYFSSSLKERKSTYNLRNSSINLNTNSPPNVTPKRLGLSFDILSKHPSTKKLKEVVNSREKNKRYSLRNSSFYMSCNSPPTKTAKSLESALSIKTEPTVKNKLKELVSKRGRKNTNVLTNSCSNKCHISRPKRNVDCIEWTPNTKTEHPMRKKLRELAHISSKKTSMTNQNLAINKDLYSSVLTRNQCKVLNSISSKSHNFENTLLCIEKSPRSKSHAPTFKTPQVSENSKKTGRKVMRKSDLSVSKRVGSVRERNNVMNPHSDKKSDPVPQTRELQVSVMKLEQDELVFHLGKSKNEAKCYSETSVIKPNFPRSSKHMNNLENKADCSQDILTPVSTRLKKRISELNDHSERAEATSFSLRGRLKKTSENVEGNKSSVKNITHEDIDATAEGKEQEELQAKTRNVRNVFQKNFEHSTEKRVTRSTTFGYSFEEHTPDNFLKKSKRHTFPNSKKCSKSKNHLRVHSVGHFNNVPIDVLIKPGNSFHGSHTHASKADFVSAKREIAPKASLKAKNNDLKKSPVRKLSLKRKKTVKLPEKSSGSNKKVPARGTLKRKRWIMKTLKDKSEGHEDDIFENSKIEISKPIVGAMISDDESDATDVSIATPICGFLLTPNISRKSPQYRPCISTNDLTAARRVAEEYLYRRNKTWKNACKNFPENKAVTSEKQGLEKRTEYSEALADVLRAQADIEKLTQEESDEDEYFSDIS